MGRRWREDALNVAEWEAWDRAQRKRLGFFAGLHFFDRNNTGGFQIVSRHWPHRLCWDWTIGWHPYRKGFDGKRQLLKVWSSAFCSAGIECWFGTLRLSWQHSEWMANSGPYRQEAPKIIWRHHVERERADAPALH